MQILARSIWARTFLDLRCENGWIDTSNYVLSSCVPRHDYGMANERLGRKNLHILRRAEQFDKDWKLFAQLSQCHSVFANGFQQAQIQQEVSPHLFVLPLPTSAFNESSGYRQNLFTAERIVRQVVPPTTTSRNGKLLRATNNCSTLSSSTTVLARLCLFGWRQKQSCKWNLTRRKLSNAIPTGTDYYLSYHWSGWLFVFYSPSFRFRSQLIHS